MAAPRCEEMASSSMSSPRSSSDSLNGLQFGHKIYFCDVGLGGGGGPSSAASTPPGKKGQPPRCQVEGCDVDLSDAKAYYSRHKVCCPHSKSSKVVVGGIQQRFCQQCSRFHQVAEFDNDKRSCRRRLAGHNERRRKPPPGSLLSNRLGRLSPSVFDGGSSSNSSNGFLVDFTSSLKAPPGSGRSSWPGTTKAPENHQHHQQGAWAGVAHTYLHQSSATGGVGAHNYPVGPSIPSGECFAGVTDSSCALSLLSSQGWSSGNHRAPPPPLNTVHFPDNNTNNHNNNNNPWSFKACEASQGLNSATSNLGLGQLPRDHHHLPSRSSGNDLDMGQSGGGPTGRQLIEFEHSVAYGSSSSTDNMNWLL